MANISGSDNMIQLNNTKIYINSGKLQNCSAQTFYIFAISNSNLYLLNTQFYNFRSILLYSSSGFIRIDNCFFNNVNLSLAESDFCIKFEKKVSFIIKSSLFENLSNFVKSVKQ